MFSNHKFSSVHRDGRLEELTISSCCARQTLLLASHRPPLSSQLNAPAHRRSPCPHRASHPQPLGIRSYTPFQLWTNRILRAWCFPVSGTDMSLPTPHWHVTADPTTMTIFAHSGTVGAVFDILVSLAEGVGIRWVIG
jgi:hypothetical protein